MQKIGSPEILTAFESCQRRGFWQQSWQKHRLSALQMLNESVRDALTYPGPDDPGEYAGSSVMTLAAERGLDVDGNKVNIYRSVSNHAAIADLILTIARKPGEAPWESAPKSSTWNSSALMDPAGDHLRRFLAVSNWNEERAASEIRSWQVLGEICQFQMPMQLVIANIGQQFSGRRRSFWSRGVMHPFTKQIRFKLSRKAHVSEFKETWAEVWREEHDEVSREKWIEGLIGDDVLPEMLFVVDVPMPSEIVVQKIRDMAGRKLDQISKLRELPERQLSTCHSPLGNCPFVDCCNLEPEFAPSMETGFDAVSGNGVPTR